MKITQNPFTSQLFTSHWLTHFNQDKPVFNFNPIGGLNFFKPGILPVFINTGRNLTKGISYSLNSREKNDIKKSVLLIYDVPAYFDIDTTAIPENVIFHKIKQYPGYLIELGKYEDFNDYLKKTFSKNTIKKLRKYHTSLTGATIFSKT